MLYGRLRILSCYACMSKNVLPLSDMQVTPTSIVCLIITVVTVVRLFVEPVEVAILLMASILNARQNAALLFDSRRIFRKMKIL